MSKAITIWPTMKCLHICLVVGSQTMQKLCSCLHFMPLLANLGNAKRSWALCQFTDGIIMMGSASQNLLRCQNGQHACLIDLFMEYSRLLCLVALTSSCFPLSFVRILRCPLFPWAFPQLTGSVTNVFAIHLPESFGAFHSVREAHKTISCMPAVSWLHLLQHIRHRATCCNTSGIMQHVTNGQGACCSYTCHSWLVW